MLHENPMSSMLQTVQFHKFLNVSQQVTINIDVDDCGACLCRVDIVSDGCRLHLGFFPTYSKKPGKFPKISWDFPKLRFPKALAHVGRWDQNTIIRLHLI